LPPTTSLPAGEPLSSLGAGRIGSDPLERGRARRAPEGLERNHRRLTNTAELRHATRYAANDRPPRMPQESRYQDRASFNISPRRSSSGPSGRSTAPRFKGGKSRIDVRFCAASSVSKPRPCTFRFLLRRTASGEAAMEEKSKVQKLSGEILSGSSWPQDGTSPDHNWTSD
jgi:hypothetical protein